MPIPGIKSFQWVKTPEKFEGAHTTPDGWPVGIYIAGGKQTARLVVKDADGNEIPNIPNVIPEHVVIVRPDGQNLMKMSECGNTVVPVTADLNKCVLLTEHSHIPESRQNPLFVGKKHYPDP